MQGVLTSLSPLAARTNNESTAASPTAGMASGSITVQEGCGTRPTGRNPFLSRNRVAALPGGGGLISARVVFTLAR